MSESAGAGAMFSSSIVLVWVEVAIVGVLIVKIDYQDDMRPYYISGVEHRTCSPLTDLV